MGADKGDPHPKFLGAHPIRECKNKQLLVKIEPKNAKFWLKVGQKRLF